jgi:hypothetical protein
MGKADPYTVTFTPQCPPHKHGPTLRPMFLTRRPGSSTRAGEAPPQASAYAAGAQRREARPDRGGAARIGTLATIAWRAGIRPAFSSARTKRIPALPRTSRASSIRSWPRLSCPGWRAVNASPDARIASRRSPLSLVAPGGGLQVPGTQTGLSGSSTRVAPWRDFPVRCGAARPGFQLYARRGAPPGHP